MADANGVSLTTNTSDPMDIPNPRKRELEKGVKGEFERHNPSSDDDVPLASLRSTIRVATPKRVRFPAESQPGPNTNTAISPPNIQPKTGDELFAIMADQTLSCWKRHKAAPDVFKKNGQVLKYYRRLCWRVDHAGSLILPSSQLKSLLGADWEGVLRHDRDPVHYNTKGELRRIPLGVSVSSTSAAEFEQNDEVQTQLSTANSAVVTSNSIIMDTPISTTIRHAMIEQSSGDTSRTETDGDRKASMKGLEEGKRIHGGHPADQRA